MTECEMMQMIYDSFFKFAGCHPWDVDGNQIEDFAYNHGPFGMDPKVVEEMLFSMAEEG
jgi:hypothetical protein